MVAPKKPDLPSDLGAEIDDLEARLERSKQRLSSMTMAGEPPVARQAEPSSRTQVRQLTVAEIDTKLGEIRAARRIRQAAPEKAAKK